MTDWTCQRTGDCCRTAEGITVTPGEFAALQAARPEVEVVWRGSEILGAPCPYFSETDGCTVHAVRPAVCRAFGCFRPKGDRSDPVEASRMRREQSAGVRRLQVRLWEDAEAWRTTHP